MCVCERKISIPFNQAVMVYSYLEVVLLEGRGKGGIFPVPSLAQPHLGLCRG